MGKLESDPPISAEFVARTKPYQRFNIKLALTDGDNLTLVGSLRETFPVLFLGFIIARRERNLPFTTRTTREAISGFMADKFNLSVRTKMVSIWLGDFLEAFHVCLERKRV